MEQIVIWVVMAVVVIFVAIMAQKQRNQNRGKSLDQRREETYERYERRMEEFRQTEMKKDESSEE